jgi:hypothetical protein
MPFIRAVASPNAELDRPCNRDSHRLWALLIGIEVASEWSHLPSTCSSPRNRIVAIGPYCPSASPRIIGFVGSQPASQPGPYLTYHE